MSSTVKDKWRKK